MVSYRKPMRLLDIANDSGLSSSTVYRFLNAFIECGYVKRNDEAQTYSLTLKLAEIGYYCMNNYQLTDNLHEYVERISRHFQETASLCVENNMQVVHLDCVGDSNRLLSSNVRIGKVVPMHCTAEGKIFLTEYSEEKLRILQERRPFYKFTENTICALDDLKGELEETMKRGFAWSKEEHEVGFKTLAVPVNEKHSKRVVKGTRLQRNALKTESYIVFIIDKSPSAAALSMGAMYSSTSSLVIGTGMF